MNTWQTESGRAALSIEPLISLMRYKQWADAELVDAACRLPRLARVIFGGVILKILRHIHAVECIFRAHLLGISHDFTSPNPAEPRELFELRPRIEQTDAWYVEYVRGLDTVRAAEVVCVTFTDGDRQTLTRAEIVWHIALHGAYHRGNLGIVLRLCGAGPLPDRLTSYLRHAASQRAFAL